MIVVHTYVLLNKKKEKREKEKRKLRAV